MTGKVLVLAPGASGGVFSCRGFSVSQARPISTVQPGADLAAIRAAMQSGVLLDLASGGPSSADVVMTPIVSTPIEDAAPARPSLSVYPGFGMEEKYLIRCPPFWIRFWNALKFRISSWMDRLAERRFQKKLQRYRRNIERTLMQ